MEHHSFIIPLSRLQEKVEKHTTVLGKYRSADGIGHLMERFSLTKGEEFLYEDYLKEALGKTYNWIKAFGRNIEHAFRYLGHVPMTEVHESDGMRISLDGTYSEGNELQVPVQPGMWDVWAVEGEEDQYRVTVRVPHLMIEKGDTSSFSVELSVGYTTLADGTFEDGCIHQEVQYSQDDLDITEYDFYAHVSQDDFPTEIASVDYVKVKILNASPATLIRKGTYLDFVLKDGTHRYGVQAKDGYKPDADQWYDTDIRDSVVFEIELPDWMDRNMLDIAEGHLEDALMNYIMFRWFETVETPVYTRGRRQEMLSDICYAKWEEHAHEAQLALNTEKRILQRKSTWL